MLFVWGQFAHKQLKYQEQTLQIHVQGSSDNSNLKLTCYLVHAMGNYVHVFKLSHSGFFER